ncbi:RNA polymerase sigma factor SigZ [Parazoarcus communis]|uniref:RNA polymerase sigma factor SigZ n=1 Tax=Parazoarcus communis TaxID=41977 RepID=A0A2U8GQH7_9RHOO|nr:RNA polymerase sigma factor SigZ [Parazoarcus communis]AWI75740.1 RNA polymerase sigma factor SigZ [Parazoarcus communis]
MKCVSEAWAMHGRELLRFVSGRIASADEANDLVQEVFLRAMLLDRGLCGIDKPRAWLFHVARNLLIDRYRLTKEQIPLNEADYPAPEDSDEPVEALTACLPRALAELAPEDREVLTLCDIEGLSHQACAERLGLTLPAAKSRILRARKRLKTRLVTACQVRFDEAGQVCCFVPRAPLE